MPWLLAGYMWLYLHRPFEIWPFLGVIRLERLYMLGVLVFWAVSPGKVWHGNRLHAAVAYLTLALAACWFFSPFAAYYGEKVVEDHFKIGVLYLLLVTSIRDEQTFKRILVCFFVAVFLYMGHSFVEFLNGRYEYRMGTIRMLGVDKTWGDPNTFAATLLHVLPLLLPFWLVPGSPKVRPLLVGYVGLTVLCILLTGSRRAFIGVGVVGFLIALGARNRWTWLLLMAMAAPVGFMALPENLQTRFLTIFDPSVGPSNAQTSANFRYLAFFQGLEMFNQYPLTGVGPGAFGRAAGHGMQAHNLYAQTPGELGFLGVSALFLIVFCFWANAREMKRLYEAHPWWEKDFVYHAGRSAWMAVLLLLFMGIGGHNLYRYNWLWFGAFQIIAVGLARRRAAAEATEYVPQDEPRGGLALGYAV